MTRGRAALLLAAGFLAPVPAHAWELTEDGRIDFFAPSGQRAGWAAAPSGGGEGSFGVYAPNGQRTGWGRVNGDGSVETFGRNGERVSTYNPNQGRVTVTAPGRAGKGGAK